MPIRNCLTAEHKFLFNVQYARLDRAQYRPKSENTTCLIKLVKISILK